MSAISDAAARSRAARKSEGAARAKVNVVNREAAWRNATKNSTMAQANDRAFDRNMARTGRRAALYRSAARGGMR